MNQRKDAPRSNRHRANRPKSRRYTHLFAAFFAGCLFAAGLFLASRFFGEIPGTTATPAPTATQELVTLGKTPIVRPTTPLADPTPVPANLQSSFDEIVEGFKGSAGISIAPVGSSKTPLNLGRWTQGPAWSTSKVPVVLAALREQGSISAAMNAAITQSDNASAEQVWTSLGDPATAASKVDDVLRGAGDQTVVQSERIRPEFTAFGQTNWSLAAQAAFISNIFCDPNASPVIGLMGQIEPAQSWGLGEIQGAKFKGGWGPSESGAYLVRQFGVIPTSNGFVAVAIAVEPSSGSFSEGTQDLDTIANWLAGHLAELPAGSCQN